MKINLKEFNLNELENLQNNKYNKNSFNILKGLVYEEMGVLGKIHLIFIIVI